MLSLQSSRLLPKVVHAAMGTLVWRRELGRLFDRILTIDVVAHMRRGIAVDVVGVILRAVPREDLEEGTQRGDISPRHVGEDDASWHLIANEVVTP